MQNEARNGAAGSARPERPRAGAGGLLSIEESVSRAKPLRSWSAADRDRLTLAVSGKLREWKEEWGLASIATEVISCETPFEPALGRLASGNVEWHSLSEAMPGVWLAMRAAAQPGPCPLPEDSSASLARALFGDSTPRFGSALSGVSSTAAGGLAIEIAQAAWSDCCARLAALWAGLDDRAPVSAGDGPTEELARTWSGALALTVPCSGQSLMVVAAGERVEQFLGSATAGKQRQPVELEGGLTPVWRAMAGQGTRLRIHLLPCELDLGSLASMRVGDVLRTGHALNTPLTVNVDGADGRDGEMVCAGFLGKVGTSRAVEIAFTKGIGETDAPSSQARRNGVSAPR